jgi:hypothetical protein
VPARDPFNSCSACLDKVKLSKRIAVSQHFENYDVVRSNTPPEAFSLRATGAYSESSQRMASTGRLPKHPPAVAMEIDLPADAGPWVEWLVVTSDHGNRRFLDPQHTGIAIEAADGESLDDHSAAFAFHCWPCSVRSAGVGGSGEPHRQRPAHLAATGLAAVRRAFTPLARAHHVISVMVSLPAVPACSTAAFWPGVTVK